MWKFYQYLNFEEDYESSISQYLAVFVELKIWFGENTKQPIFTNNAIDSYERAWNYRALQYKDCSDDFKYQMKQKLKFQFNKSSLKSLCDFFYYCQYTI